MPSLGLGLGLLKCHSSQQRLIMMGKTPIATFTRSSIAYLSDGTQVAANKPRFEPGKFGKAILIEEGTTNIIPIADWNALNGWPSAFVTQTRTIETTGLLFNGVNILKSVIEGTEPGVAACKDFAVVTTPGVVYTISAYVKSQGRPVRIWCHDGSDNGQVGSSFNVPGTDFTRLTVNFTTTGTGYCRVHFHFLSGNVGDIVWVTAPQLEQKPYATSFIDGTRAAETLTIPSYVLNPQEGTVACWAQVNDTSKYKNRYSTIFYAVAGGAGKGIWLHHSHSSANWEYQIKDENNFSTRVIVADNEIANGWHLFTAKWNSTEAKLFVDGALKGTMENPYLPSGLQKVDVGFWGSGNQLNSLIDELRIDKIARSDEEILAAYQSGQPLQWDEWTTYKANFNGKIGL